MRKRKFINNRFFSQLASYRFPGFLRNSSQRSTDQENDNRDEPDNNNMLSSKKMLAFDHQNITTDQDSATTYRQKHDYLFGEEEKHASSSVLPQSGDERSSPSITKSSSLNIAVLDDNIAILDLLHTMLTMDKHIVTRYTNGLSLLSAFPSPPSHSVNHIDVSPYDIIILDLLLPGEYSGADVFLAIRKRYPAEELPIIVITAVDEPTLEQFRRILPDNVPLLRKPFHPRQLRLLISQLTQ